MGVINDVNQTAGKVLLSKLKVKNSDSGQHNSSQQLMKNDGGIPSGPPFVLSLSFFNGVTY